MRVFNPHLRRHFLEILFICTFKTAINEFVVVPQHYEFQDSYRPRYVIRLSKAIVPINQAEIHMMVVDVIFSLLELLLDLSKSLNCFLYSGVA